MTPLLQIRLFGAPQVEQGGQSVSIQRRKTLALLAYLAVTARPHSREALAALLWPDYDPSSALANLRRDLSRLKELFGDNLLTANRQQAGLDPQAELSLDVKAFQEQVKKAEGHAHAQAPGQGGLCDECLAALERAVEIYRGDFMDGFNLPDSPAFDEWQFFEREELRQSLAGALQSLISWHVSKGEYEQALPYARRWLALDPLHEPAHRSLMQLYAWSGQQAAALRQYQESVRILQEELGVEPEEETRALYESVKARALAYPRPAGESQAGTKMPRQLPRTEGRFSQAIRFVTAPDGVRLAYAVAGQGPPLVKAANWLSHLEYDWSSPVWRHWLAGLSREHTLVRYDERGCGLSDRNVDEFNLEAWVLDLETVVDALGLERFPLLGMSQGASIAVEYAARHPERVSRLILYGGYLRGRLHRDLSPEQREEQEVLIQLIKIGWGKEHPAFRQVFAMLFLPEGTPEQLQAFNELERMSSSPEIAARIVSGFQSLDVRAQASRVTQPALVLHARGDLRIPFEEGRLMAAALPNARLVPLESNNHILLEGEPAWGRFMEEVSAFLNAESG